MKTFKIEKTTMDNRTLQNWVCLGPSGYIRAHSSLSKETFDFSNSILTMGPRNNYIDLE